MFKKVCKSFLGEGCGFIHGHLVKEVTNSTDVVLGHYHGDYLGDDSHDIPYIKLQEPAE